MHLLVMFSGSRCHHHLPENFDTSARGRMCTSIRPLQNSGDRSPCASEPSSVKRTNLPVPQGQRQGGRFRLHGRDHPVLVLLVGVLVLLVGVGEVRKSVSASFPCSLHLQSAWNLAAATAVALTTTARFSSASRSPLSPRTTTKVILLLLWSRGPADSSALRSARARKFE